jgi:hypothetical protein
MIIVADERGEGAKSEIRNNAQEIGSDADGLRTI